MIFNAQKLSWENWQKHHDIVQTVNFTLGLILVVMTLIFMVTDQAVNTLVLGLCGILALWAGVSKNRRMVYVIDMLLGFIFIFSSATTSFSNHDVPIGNLLFRGTLGIIFLVSAYWARRFWKDTLKREKDLSDDFEP